MPFDAVSLTHVCQYMLLSISVCHCLSESATVWVFVKDPSLCLSVSLYVYVSLYNVYARVKQCLSVFVSVPVPELEPSLSLCLTISDLFCQRLSLLLIQVRRCASDLGLFHFRSKILSCFGQTQCFFHHLFDC